MIFCMIESSHQFLSSYDNQTSVYFLFCILYFMNGIYISLLSVCPCVRICVRMILALKSYARHNDPIFIKNFSYDFLRLQKSTFDFRGQIWLLESNWKLWALKVSRTVMSIFINFFLSIFIIKNGTFWLRIYPRSNLTSVTKKPPNYNYFKEISHHIKQN